MYNRPYSTNHPTKKPPDPNLQLGNKPTPIHLDQILLRNLLDLGDTSQAHGKPNLIAQQSQSQLDALLTLVSETPEDGTTDPDEIRAESESLEDVGAVADAAVYVDWDFALDCGGDFGKGIQSC